MRQALPARALVGSGKLGMPWARMHCESPSGEALPVAVVAPTALWPLSPEAPHADRATAQPAVASAAAGRTAGALRL